MPRPEIDSRYDIVVIGSGIGGLTAGALLAKAGKKVLVAEQHSRLGGYAQYFKRRGFHFDSSVHFSGGGLPTDDDTTGAIYSTLELLHVQDRCTFTPMDPFVRLIAPGLTIDLPPGMDRLADTLCERFGSESKRIRKFMKLCLALDHDLRVAPDDPTVVDMMLMPFRFPRIVRYGNWSVQKGLDHFFSDPVLKTLFGVLTICFATPPSRASFAMWTHLVTSFIHERVGYCTGTFQRLADALATGLRNYDGLPAIKARVTNIRTSGGHVRGVTLEGGQEIDAPVVVSDVDMLQTYSTLLDTQARPARHIAKLRSLRPTLSAFCVYIATDLDMHAQPVVHENVLLDSLDIEQCYGYTANFRPRSAVVAVPSLSDPSVAPEGKHVISALSFVPYASISPENREKLKDNMIDRICDLLPDLRDHILFVETAVPTSYERYTANHQGAALGWECAVDQVGHKRPWVVSPVKGLYHAGHWTQPGGGIYGTLVSGRIAAQYILGYKTAGEFVRALESVD